MNFDELLNKLCEYDRLAEKTETELLQTEDQKGLRRFLSQAGDDALAKQDLGRLERVVRLWGHLEGPPAIEALLGLALHEEPRAREIAGEELVAVASADFKAFAKEVRKILDTADERGPVMEELAFLVTETESPESVDLLVDLLGHRNSFVVLGALEVAGEWAWDPRIEQAISRLVKDRREVTIEDEEEGEVTVTLGELAADIHESLRALAKGRCQ